MKISYNWLKKFVDFELNPKELTCMLTSLGIGASIVSIDFDWTNVYTVKILDIQKHPSVSKLSICNITDGSKEYSVVCGAKNIAVGQIVPFAKIGAVLHDGYLKIEKIKIRGFESEGMLCSKKELGLGMESEKVFVLNENVNIGIALENVLDDVDSILEIEITTNRGDCLSHLGVAREIAAKLHKMILMPKIKNFDVIELDCIEIKSDLCLRYIGGIISGVRIASSPEWIIDALAKSGIKSINNVVDITNYVMIELGQPLHAFDVSKLFSEKKIIVRQAVELEMIAAIDGKEYKLASDMLVIADSQKPIAVAGIMGGEYSGIDDKTETVFLESAIFDATSIRKTSKILNLSSNSSYRFERGLSWDMAEFAFWRSVNLIIDIAGGKFDGMKDLQTVRYEKTKIALSIERVSKILGYDVKEDEILKILRFLAIDLQLKDNIIFCIIPSWRNDIKVEVDLIEEIARMKGYDTIPLSKKYEKCIDASNSSFLSVIVKEFRFRLIGLGFSEALNYSFLEFQEIKKFDLKCYYKIIKSMSKENEVLRPSLLPGLYKNLLFNVGYGAETVTLFEHGKIFGESGERKTFGIIMYGKVWQDWWKWTEQKNVAKYDFYFGSGVIKNILPSGEFTIVENLTPKNYYHYGKTSIIVYKNKNVGHFGVLKSSFTEDIKDEVFYCEIDLELIEKKYIEKTFIYKAYSNFPVVKRDISVVADKTLELVKIEKIIKDIMKSGNILKEYSLFSVYADEFKLGKGKISYSFRLSYKDDVRTLTDKEVGSDVDALLDKLNTDLDVKLRE
jgi:phenylalanyl-tRNA synthetase beta chain